MSENNREPLITHREELVKQYIELDGSGRAIRTYTVRTYAVDGEKCIVTEYEYSGNSTTILKRKEYYGTWSSAYDI